MVSVWILSLKGMIWHAWREMYGGIKILQKGNYMCVPKFQKGVQAWRGNIYPLCLHWVNTFIGNKVIICNISS